MRCAARARWGDDLIPVREAEFDDPSLMDAALGQVDVVIHPAGVNRAHDPAEIARVNPWLAEQLTASMDRTGRRIPVVRQPIHALGDSVFGVSQAQGGGHPAGGHRPGRCGDAEHLRRARGAELQLGGGDVLPRAGRRRDPAGGGRQGTAAGPRGHDCRSAAGSSGLPTPGRIEVPGRPTMVSEVAQRLTAIAAELPHRAAAGPVGPVHQGTFQHLPVGDVPAHYPIRPVPSDDPRGWLVEAVKGAGGQTQVFY